MSKKQQKPKRLFKRMRENHDYWPHLASPHRYRYYFHPKHHGSGSTTDSRWKPDVLQGEEFRIFEIAAQLDLSDESGNLYNVLKRADNTFRELGIFHEQIARFWKPIAPEAWHGHPLWPVESGIATNRSSERYRPDKSVFRKLVDQKVLSVRDSYRLRGGKNI